MAYNLLGVILLVNTRTSYIQIILFNIHLTHMEAPVPTKQPWRIWVYELGKAIRTLDINTHTPQKTAKTYALGKNFLLLTCGSLWDGDLALDAADCEDVAIARGDHTWKDSWKDMCSTILTHWPMTYGSNLELPVIILNLLSISCETALRWMPQNLTNEKSTLVLCLTGNNTIPTTM